MAKRCECSAAASSVVTWSVQEWNTQMYRWSLGCTSEFGPKNVYFFLCQEYLQEVATPDFLTAFRATVKKKKGRNEEFYFTWRPHPKKNEFACSENNASLYNPVDWQTMHHLQERQPRQCLLSWGAGCWLDHESSCSVGVMKLQSKQLHCWFIESTTAKSNNRRCWWTMTISTAGSRSLGVPLQPSMRSKSLSLRSMSHCRSWQVLVPKTWRPNECSSNQYHQVACRNFKCLSINRYKPNYFHNRVQSERWLCGFCIFLINFKYTSPGGSEQSCTWLACTGLWCVDFGTPRTWRQAHLVFYMYACIPKNVITYSIRAVAGMAMTRLQRSRNWSGRLVAPGWRRWGCSSLLFLFGCPTFFLQ